MVKQMQPFDTCGADCLHTGDLLTLGNPLQKGFKRLNVFTILTAKKCWIERN